MPRVVGHGIVLQACPVPAFLHLESAAPSLIQIIGRDPPQPIRVPHPFTYATPFYICHTLLHMPHPTDEYWYPIQLQPLSHEPDHLTQTKWASVEVINTVSQHSSIVLHQCYSPTIQPCPQPVIATINQTPHRDPPVLVQSDKGTLLPLVVEGICSRGHGSKGQTPFTHWVVQCKGPLALVLWTRHKPGCKGPLALEQDTNQDVKGP